MKTRIVEASNGPQNWGKFLVGRMDSEWSVPSALPGFEGGSVVAQRGWSRDHLWVMDLQTGEGACFRPGGHAGNDLEKHQIWVCPLFEPFLTWLYQQDLTDLEALPAHVDLDAPFSMSGYRRNGPSGMTPPLAFTQAENSALLAATSAAVQQLEGVEKRAGLPSGEVYRILNSLRTLFTEQGYAFERAPADG